MATERKILTDIIQGFAESRGRSKSAKSVGFVRDEVSTKILFTIFTLY